MVEILASVLVGTTVPGVLLFLLILPVEVGVGDHGQMESRAIQTCLQIWHRSQWS